MLSGGIGWYSSRLKVTTPRKLSPSSRCIRISSRYTPIGVEPVASPSTGRAPAALRSDSTAAIRRAMTRESASWLSTTTVGIFSNRVPGAAMSAIYTPIA